MSEPATLQTIPETFRHEIYTHFLIARLGSVAMYAKTQSHGKGVRWEYEVVLIRQRKAAMAFGKPQPASERMPGNGDFGEFGWHFTALSAAWIKFNQLASEKSPGTPRLKHPQIEQFENSIKVETFDSQRRPAGSFQKRRQIPLDSIRACSLVPT